MGDKEGKYQSIEDRGPQASGRRPEPLVRSAAALDEKHDRLPPWLSSKETACIAGGAGDAGSISEAERSPGGRHGTPL